MKLFFLIFILSFYNSIVFAQQSTNEIVVNLNSPTPTIDTSNLKSVSSVTLQALTPDTSVVGYVAVADTASNVIYSLVPQTQLTNWLQSYMNATYDPAFSDTGKHVYWLIKNFNLSESINNKSVYVHVEASIYMGSFDNSNAYWELDTVLKYQHPIGNDYAKPYQSAIQMLLSYSVNKINFTSDTSALRVKSGIRPGALYSTNSLVPDISNLPIIKDSAINEGAFLTLAQFVNNNPSITKVIVQVEDSSIAGNVHVYQLMADSSLQELTGVFSVCIAGELYVFKNLQMIPIERTNNSMVLSRFRDPLLRINQALYMRLIFNNSPGNENPYGKEYASEDDPDAVATAIDLQTGNLTF